MTKTENPVKKGDIVALETTSTINYINPYRSEQVIEWTLVRVAKASREGIVKAIEHLPIGKFPTMDLGRLSGKNKVHTVNGPNQELARKLAATMEAGKFWKTADELRAAILTA